MANQRFRCLKLWRKLAKRELVIAGAGGIALLLLALPFVISDSRRSQHSSSIPVQPSVSDSVPLTTLLNARGKGAFCLDGSLPGYHFRKGFGSGSDNWLIHIEGGGWCDSIESCSSRKNTELGSSKYMDIPVLFNGIMSSHPSQNPDFFNWNRVKVRYCDGASFSGHPESELKSGSKLFFRGQLIWEAVMDELLSIGLANARQALLAGCSAGGLATLIHCDSFREILPRAATVKCLADAGFFLNEKDIAGNRTMESLYHRVADLHGATKSLNKDCLAKLEPSEHFQCLFPRQFVKNLKTPVFLLQPAYDFWQIHNILVPASSDPHGNWHKCRRNIADCSPGQIEVLHGYRNSLLKALSEFKQNNEFGMFINSCYVHCETGMAHTWHSPDSPRINNKTIAESVGDWYFNREESKQIDCPYPCNPTCFNLDFNKFG